MSILWVQPLVAQRTRRPRVSSGEYSVGSATGGLEDKATKSFFRCVFCGSSRCWLRGQGDQEFLPVSILWVQPLVAQRTRRPRVSSGEYSVGQAAGDLEDKATRSFFR